MTLPFARPARLGVFSGVAFALLSLLATPGRATTLTVPSTKYPTIQSAISAANTGDTVLVADGTYRGADNTDLDFGGTDIIVQSVHGAAKTIIDCQGSSTHISRAFNFHSNETSKAIVNGFTIENGYEHNDNDNGGGISVKGSDPTITNCTFTNNTSNSHGGAISGDNSSPTITNCTFNTNSAYYGGTMYFYQSSPTITNCTFTNNTATVCGAILPDQSSKLTITGCTFTNNSATKQAGVIWVNSSTAAVTSCTFTRNICHSDWPSGIGITYGSAAITHCSFTANSGTAVGIQTSNSTVNIQSSLFAGNTSSEDATAVGGALFTYGDSTITNCIFVGNGTPAGSGGALWFNKTLHTTVTNCTFSGNSAPKGSGGAIDIVKGATPTLTNCIFYGDSATKGSEIAVDSQAGVLVTYCDVKSGYKGTGNISADPQFVSTAGNDFHLQSTSPCIRAGTALGAPLIDVEGTVRPNPPSMGAYEVIHPTITSFSPTSGPFGTKVTITGTNFLKASAVHFDATAAASFKVVSTTTITVSVPYGAKTGTISVTTPGGTAVSAKSFTVTSSPVLAVKSLVFNPSTIAAGGLSTGTVTLSGTAPTGGATVPILSGGFLFTTVTVPAGKTSATFTAIADPYAPDGVYLFIATYNGTSTSGTLTIHGG